MRNVICHSVLAQQEGGNGCRGGVVTRCDVKLEEVEQGERGQEERCTPYRVMKAQQKEECDCQCGAERCTEEGSAEGDGGEGSRAGREGCRIDDGCRGRVAGSG